MVWFIIGFLILAIVDLTIDEIRTVSAINRIINRKR